jgi:small ligand-binding sensory domain FIST
VRIGVGLSTAANARAAAAEAALLARERLIAATPTLAVLVTYRRGDFVIRAVTGADQDTGALQVGDLVEVGATVQFHVRDAVTADEDLRESLLRACRGSTDGGPVIHLQTGAARACSICPTTTRSS